jgi:hypothetical protein
LWSVSLLLDECLAGQIEAQETLLDLTIAPFEPLTPGSAVNVVERKDKLANAIRENFRGGSGES